MVDTAPSFNLMVVVIHSGKMLLPRHSYLDNSQMFTEGYINDGNDFWKVNVPGKNSEWECHIGLDHQTIRNVTRDVEVDLTYFVPPDRDLEYWYLKITNRGQREKTLQVFATAELSLGNTLRAYISHEMNLYGTGWQENGSLYATTTLWGKGGTMVENVHWPMKAFFTSTRKFCQF